MLQSEKRMIRDSQLLQSLDNLGFATRKQLQVVCNLGGDRNAARILLRLERDKLIQSERRECKVYSLTYDGKELIGNTTKVRIGQMEHTLMRNDLYIKLGMPNDWKAERSITFDDEKIKCDAMFTKGNEFHFVEIDCKRKMQPNYEKLNKYAQLSKAIFKHNNHHPTIIFYTLTHSRKEKLEGYMRKVGVKGVVMV